MRRGRRRRPEESARYRTPATASRPFRRRTRETICSRDGSALRMPSIRKTCGRSFEPLAALDAVLALGIDDGNQANDAAAATIQVPRKKRESAAPAGDLVEIAADILDAEDAVVEQDTVHRLPFRKVIFPVAAARPFAIFFREMRMQRTVTLRTDRGSQRVIVGLGIVADHLHLFLDEPFASRRHKAW